MKCISIEIREQKGVSGSSSISVTMDDTAKISLNQINTILSNKQYKKVKKKLRLISKIINCPT